MSELQTWLERIHAAQNTEEVFSILDEFRPLLWSDEERATMAKTYNTKLHVLNAPPPEEKKGKQKAKTTSNISKQDAGNQRGESTSSLQEVDEDEISL